MSLLFHKNTKSTIKWMWYVIASIIVISMVASLTIGLWGGQ
jgi:hypothetical protein